METRWREPTSGGLPDAHTVLLRDGKRPAAGEPSAELPEQFGTRAGLLVQMVRERDASNPRGERVAAALAAPDPVEALVALTRELAGWWREIHPVARALYAAALTDEAARAAWEDRMAHLHEFSEQLVGRLAQAGVLASSWEPALASDWLAAQLNPLGWLLLVEDSGWTQELYEQRTATTVRQVLLEPAVTAPDHDRAT
jgi:hypothetical protein